MHKTIIIAVLALVCATSQVSAESSKAKLVGYWKFKRGIGGPCESLIEKLEYTFQKGGKYHGKSKMSTGATLEYSGTYSATDTECTTFIDGQTIGPFPYEITNDILTITQPDFDCKVQLEREDY